MPVSNPITFPVAWRPTNTEHVVCLHPAGNSHSPNGKGAWASKGIGAGCFVSCFEAAPGRFCSKPTRDHEFRPRHPPVSRSLYHSRTEGGAECNILFCNASKVREICFSFVRVQASYTSSKMGVYSTKLLARLEDCEQRKMVGSLLQKNGRLRIGTACSGSDAPVMVVKSLVSLFQTHIAANPSIYGSIPLAVDFVFSCEANQGSAWAATEMRPQYAFVDVGHLGQTFAWDVEQQCDARVPEVDVFILGFSCKCLISKDGRVFVSYCMLL